MFFEGLHPQHRLDLYYSLLILAEVCAAHKANKFEEADEDLIAKINAIAQKYRLQTQGGKTTKMD